MEKENKKIMYEALLLHELGNNIYNNTMTDVGYSTYNAEYENSLLSLRDRYISILNYKGDENNFINFMSNINLTNEQRIELVKIRKEPLFKKIMGETALSKKSELENLLNIKITSQGPTILDENGLTISVKGVDVLNKEISDYSDKLTVLFESGQITLEQYDSYNQTLDYIYEYYISLSKGEQISLSKISNAELEAVEKMAFYKNDSVKKPKEEIYEDRKYDFEVVQEVAQSVSNKSR